MSDLTVPPPMPEPTVRGTAYHPELKIAYSSTVHFTAEQIHARDAIWSERVAALLSTLSAGIDKDDHIASLQARLEAAERDAARLDWLEQQANEPGGLLLHAEQETGRRGLGLRPGQLVRSLRDAIDATQEKPAAPSEGSQG